MYRVVNRSFNGTESVYLARDMGRAIDAFIEQAFYPARTVRIIDMVSWGLVSTGSFSAASKDRGMVRVEKR
jgi:hypothetical protein